jgi:hypothetical protein
MALSTTNCTSAFIWFLLFVVDLLSGRQVVLGQNNTTGSMGWLQPAELFYPAREPLTTTKFNNLI